MHLLGETNAPTGLVLDAFGEPERGIEPSDFPTDILKIFTFHERLARGAADREALQVPRDVLAQIMHRHAFVAVVELGEQPGVTQDHRAHVAERRVDPLRAAGERVLDVGEQPGPALASANMVS